MSNDNEQSKSRSEAKDFDSIKADELKALQKLRTNANKDNLIGLAFSGGGIRSATINLGVLQGLAKYGLLSKFDYLSTVSGGGYPQAWLSALIKRHPLKLKGVEDDLAQSSFSTKNYSLNITEHSIQWLRSYSNYLTPKTGLFTTDTLAAFAQWCANTLLNQILLLASLVFFMMLIIGFSSYTVPDISIETYIFHWDWIILKNHWSDCIPLLGILMFASSVVSAFWNKRNSSTALNNEKNYTAHIIYTVGFIGLALVLYGLPEQTISHTLTIDKLRSTTALATPNYLLIIGLPIATIVISVLISLVRPIFKLTAIESEWWYRLGGINIKACTFWLVLYGCAICIPYYLYPYIQNIPTYKLNIGTILGWLIPLATAKLGKSKFSSGDSIIPGIKTLSKIMPYIAIGLILIGTGLLSYVMYQSQYRGLWFLISFGIIIWGSLKFNINVFSLHNFYRNRLTRCYLGASNFQRAETLNIFSGFAEDDIGLATLQDQKPIPIINTALNISDGSELAMQQSKAAAFFFTPYYSGFEFRSGNGRKKYGFIETSQYVYPNYSREPNSKYNGPFIGSLIAVSGAAASPNMGYHTNRVMGIIMTIFNARLGRWFGNPNNPKAARKSSPSANLFYLLTELFTNANANSNYFYLSDGGHFENLGIYELVRRECKLIIAVDAEEDSKYQFEGLGNAIRKCKVDFGATITINLNDLYPTGSSSCGNYKVSKKHVSLGEIHYADGKKGVLVYAKSSLTSSIPTDLINFKLQESAFPHHSTVDQFFDESQFESYRQLGQLIAEDISREVVTAKLL